MPSQDISSLQKNESTQDENLKSEEVPSNNQSNEPKSKTNSRYPRGIPFILMFKFGERFSFYTFFVILTLYLHQELNFDESTSPIIFHTFMMLVYITPILGALLADAYLAKFWTISYMAVLFVVGKMLVFTGSSLRDVTSMRAISILGLFLVAVAEGALKPCSSAFGGDQFEDRHYKQRKRYFSLYFFIIYSSHILASFLAPVLRSHVRCFGKDTCYPLAFGAAAMFSFLGTTAFLTGKPFYIITAVQDGILIQVFKCIGYALSRKMRNKYEKKDHWLDYSEDQFDKSLISDIKALFHVIQVFIPLPVYVTLFHQVGSTWVLQGSKMDGEIWGYRIKPDQMVMLLPILMIILIPTFEFAMYPLLNKLGLLRTQLQKIGTGGLLNALAFIMAGVVQLSIESDLPTKPKAGFGELTVINNSPCTVNFTGEDNIGLKAFQTKTLKDLPMMQERLWHIAPSGCSAQKTVDKHFRLETQFETMMITLGDRTLGVFVRNDSRVKLKNGNPRLRLFYRTENANASFIFRGSSSVTVSTNDSTLGMTEYWDMQPGTYEIYFQSNDSSFTRKPVGSSKLRNGGSYIVAIYQNSSENTSRLIVIPTLRWNSVHILFQLPQFLAIASAEVMFAITGVAFSYAEAPLSMKAVVHACWFLNYAFGNAVVLFLKFFFHLLKDSHRFFIFGILMLVAMMVFVVLAHFYTYISDENKKL
ncbi:Solute carrier family 15 member 2 [Araneus ventricosus]|uniref:Solute carrier family 15 member 2 n=1 Tax=Araneus ventricosus TaxID=182803 RepID=A0A4Y2UQ15_ARAVE|nr:Solute carrier family 15 member 2 [Araneus ventricosus]